MAHILHSQAIILTIPGFQGSGATHWQTRWEENYENVHRIQQRSWNEPSKQEWIENIENTVRQYSHQPIVLVAHSLGTIAVAHWAAQTQLQIAGAFLVAPPNLIHPELEASVANFNPFPLQKLPFKSIVVASTNDRYGSIQYAHQNAQAWGSQFIDIGDCGHINAESNLDIWPQGLALLQTIV